MMKLHPSYRHIISTLYLGVASIRFLLRQDILDYPVTRGTSFVAWIFLLVLFASFHLSRRLLGNSHFVSLLFEAGAMAWSLTNSFLLLLPLQFFWFLFFVQNVQPRTSLPPPRITLGLLLFMLLQCSLSMWILLGGQVPSGHLNHRSLLSSSHDATLTQTKLDQSLSRWFAAEPPGTIDWLRQNTSREIWIWLQSDIGCNQSLAHERNQQGASQSILHACLFDMDPMPTLWRAFQSLTTSSSQAGQETLFHSGERLWTDPLPSSLHMAPLMTYESSSSFAAIEPPVWIGVMPWATDLWHASVTSLEDPVVPSWAPPDTDLWLLSSSHPEPDKTFVYCNTGQDPFRRLPTTSAPCDSGGAARVPWTIYTFSNDSSSSSHPSTFHPPKEVVLWSFADLGSLARLLVYMPPHPLQDVTLSWARPDLLLELMDQLTSPPQNATQHRIQSRWRIWALLVAPLIQRHDLLRQWYREYDVTPLVVLSLDTRDPEVFFYRPSPPTDSLLRSLIPSAVRDWIQPCVDSQLRFYRRLVVWTTLRNALLLGEASWLFFVWTFGRITFSFPQLLPHLLGQVLYLLCTNILVRSWYSNMVDLPYWDANVFLMRSHDIIHMVTSLICLLVVPFSIGLLVTYAIHVFQSQWVIQRPKEWHYHRLLVTWFLWVTTALLPQVGVQSLFPWIWNSPAGGSLWLPLSFALQGVLHSFLWIGFLVGSMYEEGK